MLARRKSVPARVWKRGADDGVVYPISPDIEFLREVIPDCATCMDLCDSVRWRLRSGRYYVTVSCHGQEETRVLTPSLLEGAERVVVEPAFQPQRAIVLAPRVQLAPVWLVRLCMDAVRRAGRWLAMEL